MKKIKPLIALLIFLPICGCTVISYNRVFPKLTWYWSAEAKAQRAEQSPPNWETNFPSK